MFPFTLGERIFIGWLINQLKGLNKSDARLVRSLNKSLDLDNAQQAQKGEIDTLGVYEITGLEVQWLADQTNKHFESSSVPVMFAEISLELLDKIEQFKAGTLEIPDLTSEPEAPPEPDLVAEPVAG